MHPSGVTFPTQPVAPLPGSHCSARSAPFEADATFGTCHPSRNAITHYAPCNCTIVAYLHLRKCGGTAIRSLFRMQGQRWKMPIIYVPRSSVASEAQRLVSAWRPSEGARWHLEVHTSPGLEAFVDQVTALRRVAARRGCQVIAATMLREPSAMAKSELAFFGSESEKLGRSLASWMRAKPELLLLGGGGTSVSGGGGSLGYRYLGLGPRLGEASRHQRSAPQPEAVRRAQEAFTEAVGRWKLAAGDARAEARRAGASGAPRRDRRRDGKARALQAAQDARGAWIGELRASGLMECGELTARADELLGKLDLVGVLEEFDASTLLLYDAAGLQSYSHGRMHYNAAKPSAEPSWWQRLAGRNGNEGAGEITPELRALNNCSALLHARWKEKLRERVASQPAHFAARLAAMREERAGRRGCRSVGKPKAAKTVRPSARAAKTPTAKRGPPRLWQWLWG